MLTTIWAVLEPLLVAFQLSVTISTRNKLQISNEDIDEKLSRAFDEFKAYIMEFGVEPTAFAPNDKQIYLNFVKKKLTYRNEMYVFYDGQIEYFLSRRFDLPTEHRFDKFLLNSYLLIRLKKFKRFSFVSEKYVALIRKKKKSVFHYLGISNWRNKTKRQLLSEIENASPVPLNVDEYRFADLWKYTEDNKDSSLKKILDKVLKGGKITESAIINMASSEKLLVVYKYGEGFSNVHTRQTDLLKDLKEKIKRYRKRTTKISQTQLRRALVEKQNLLDNWVRAPIGEILEKKGFKHLFSQIDQIYFLPVSMLPRDYQSSPKLFITEVVLEEAKQRLEEVRDNDFMYDFVGGLKYILVSHIVRVSDMNIIKEERNLDSFAPMLESALLTTTIDNEGSYINRIFINDVVRNVDFLQFLKPSKTAEYIKHNFEHLKQILYQNYQIDIYKPAQLIQLSEVNISDIAERLVVIDSTARKHHVFNLLMERLDFYRKLSSELEELKINK
jgi:hypothetical protein